MIDDAVAGNKSFQVGNARNKAICPIKGTVLYLNSSRFWKPTVAIADMIGNILLKIYTKKWHTNAFVFELAPDRYSLSVSNKQAATLRLFWIFAVGFFPCNSY